MTGLERNADVVNMASYAPLLSNVDAWQWAPDLIWFNSLQAYTTPNYYVQKLYSNNKGTQALPITYNGNVVAGDDSLYATACLDKESSDIILKIANTGGSTQTNTIALEGIKKLAAKGLVTVLQNNDLRAVNSFGKNSVAPQESEIAVKGKTITVVSAPYSFTVVRIKAVL